MDIPHTLRKYKQQQATKPTGIAGPLFLAEKCLP